MPLTDLKCRGAKAPEKPIKLSDGGGLHLLVNPTGSRLWRLAYRFDGKQKLLSFGPYPQVSLADARAKRDAAKETLAGGHDPSAKAKVAKATRQVANANTFGVIADELLARMEREDKAPSTIKKVKWLLEFARPDLGSRPISEISAAEILAVLRQVEILGRLESARRLRSTIGSVFRLAIATARAENDPTIALQGALTSPKVTHYAAITEPKRLGALMRAVWGYEGQPATLAALKLMALLLPRPGELRKAEWSHFNLEAENPVWTVSTSTMKMRRAHSIPLARQAVGILRDLQAITGRGRLVFPGMRTIDRPISENTMNGALRRLGFAKDEMTSHGFRSSASTLLNESGDWAEDAIERALSHLDRNAVRRAYARGEYWDERVRMMQCWADQLDRLREGGEAVPAAGERVA